MDVKIVLLVCFLLVNLRLYFAEELLDTDQNGQLIDKDQNGQLMDSRIILSVPEETNAVKTVISSSEDLETAAGHHHGGHHGYE